MYICFLSFFEKGLQALEAAPKGCLHDVQASEAKPLLEGLLVAPQRVLARGLLLLGLPATVTACTDIVSVPVVVSLLAEIVWRICDNVAKLRGGDHCLLLVGVKAH